MEKGVPFIWTDFNPLPPRTIYDKSGENWPCSSKENFKMIPSLFYNFMIISPLKTSGLLFEQTLIPFIQG
jgi:hypothetical protein